MPARSMLVLHGALGSAGQMRPIAEALGEFGAVENAEFPGHGATPIGEHPFSVVTFAAFVTARVMSRRARNQPAPFVFGYSMGGYVALMVEAISPGSFAGIATYGTKYLWSPEEAARQVKRLDPAVIRTKVPDFAAALEARHAAGDGWEAMLRGTASLLTELGGMPVLNRDVLERVECPVLVLAGARDLPALEDAGPLSEHLPRGHFEEIADAEHAIESVPPGTIARAMSGLIARAEF